MTDLTSLSNSVVGMLVPWIVCLIKRHLLPWSGKAALWLSFAISCLCVTACYFVADRTPSLTEYISNISIAFSLSQVVYEHIQDGLNNEAT